ncbi:MAG: hypothetical protein JXR63_00025 [Spirochaetales bacterium]|nr:hypothetical protein [Spirochaetales bacterium]
MKRMYLLTLILFIFSCDLPDFKTDPMTNDSGDKSVLEVLLSESVIDPPIKGTAFVANEFGIAKANLIWDSVPFASYYEVYSSRDGENFEFKKYASENSFSEDILDFSSDLVYYKLRSVTTEGMKSGFSPSYMLSLTESKEVGSVEDLFVSKGVSKNIVLTWIPSHKAFSYTILRRETGSSEFSIVNDRYIPIDPSSSSFSWTDRGAESSRYYDYQIIPVNEVGFSGLPSPVAIKGFSYPSAVNCSATKGSFVRGVAGSNGYSEDYSVIDISWMVSKGILYSDGTYDEVSADKWDVYSVFDPTSSDYLTLDQVFDINIENPKPLNAFYEFDGSFLTRGLESFSQSVSDPRLFYKDAEVDGIPYVQWVYRLGISDIQIPEIEFNSSWEKFYYFRIAGIYNSSEFNEYISPFSSMSRGFAANPEAMNFEPSDFSFSASASGSSITILLPPMIDTESGVEVQKYEIMKRIAGSLNYDLLVSIDSSSQLEYQYEDTGLDSGAYEYAIRFVGTDGIRTHFTDSVIVVVGGNDE